MLSRRLLRVKVMQMVYAHHKKGNTSIKESEQELLYSISKSFELYHLFLLLIVDIHAYAVNRIEKGKSKKMPTPEELTPNTRFVENKVLLQLASNKQLLDYLKQHKISWVNFPELIKTLFDLICKSDLYSKYLEDDSSDYESHKKFVIKIVEKVIAQHEPLYAQLEEQSIFWNDESEFIFSMGIKTLKEFTEASGDNQPLHAEFKDEEDSHFVVKLFHQALLNHEKYNQLISKFAKNWEMERVAFMDIVLMHVALAEVIEFQEIPVKVSLNEYIELAKHYSTSKSALFINGLLDKIIASLANEGKIVKTGKGLIETS